MNTAPIAARLLAWLTRLITGVRAQWAGAAPTTAQRVYHANHSSHLDTLVIWASLPAPLRARTRPVAAADYWDRPGLRRWLACQVRSISRISAASCPRARCCRCRCFQYVFGKTLGKRPIVPRLSPNKTWEDTVGGIVAATLVGTLLWWVTPFTPWAAAVIALLICLTGFAGGLVMSAIKRDRGVKDFGTLIEGHGGILDRIDSLCFAAPVFFHVVRYYYT